jgi:hypothetical protein
MAVFKQYVVEDTTTVRRPAVLKPVAARPARNIALAPERAPDETKFTRF